MVFGFEKLKGLKRHTVRHGRDGSLQFSYQDGSHPLAGSAQGGRLKEIELQSLQDLATLSLGLWSASASLPAWVVVRIRPSQPASQKSAGNATYLSADQVQGFQSRLAEQVADMAGIPLQALSDFASQASIAKLQRVNDVLRRAELQHWVPQRQPPAPAPRQ